MKQVAKSVDWEKRISISSISSMLGSLRLRYLPTRFRIFSSPQVNRSIQVVVLEVENNERYPDEAPIPVTALVNPVLSDFSEETVLGWESCLSLIDFRGLVSRSASVMLNAYDREGNKVEKRATGFEAVVLQHEIDHLNGKVFLDRMEDLTQLAYQEEFEEFWLKKDSVP